MTPTKKKIEGTIFNLITDRASAMIVVSGGRIVEAAYVYQGFVGSYLPRVILQLIHEGRYVDCLPAAMGAQAKEE